MKSYWDEGVGNRKRKYYRITSQGQNYAKEKRQEWAAFRPAEDKALGG